MTRKLHALGVGAALLAGASLLAACGDKREAEAETPTAEAEVTTTLPESQVSDQQLQNAAEGAAAMAETPQAGASVVVSPPPSGAAGTPEAPAGATTTPPPK